MNLTRLLKKELNLILLVVGVALAASGGVQFGETDFQRVSLQGEAALESESASKSASETSAAPPNVRAEVDPAARFMEWVDVGAVLFLAGVVLIIAGALGTRRQERAQAAELGRQHDTLDLSAHVSTLISGVQVLRQRLDESPVPRQDVLDGIEQLQVEQLDPLLANRHALELRFGLAGFASLVGPLSSAERFLNRAWTTLVDHHVAESASSLEQAITALESVIQAYQDIESAVT